MSIRRKIGAAAATAGLVVGMSVASATSASAQFACFQESPTVKVCTSGFTSNEWTGTTQFIQVHNPFAYRAWFHVYTAGTIDRQMTCIDGGGKLYVDRGTTQVGTTLAAGKLGWGPAAPC